MKYGKTGIVTIRMTAEEYNWLVRAANAEILTMSAFARRILIKHLKENYPKLEKK